MKIIWLHIIEDMQ